MKDYESPFVFRWVMDNTYPPQIKKCWHCQGEFFVQKDKNSPFICIKCGKEN